MKATTCIIFIALLLTLTPTMTRPAAAAETPLVYLDPPVISEVGEGENFVVTVRVDAFVGLYAWAINVSWDPAVLDFVGATEGSCLASNGTALFLNGAVSAGNITNMMCTLLDDPAVYFVNVPPGPDDFVALEFQVVQRVYESSITIESTLVDNLWPGTEPYFPDVLGATVTWHTSAYIDFGTGASPREFGYTAVSESTLYSAFVGYGWESTVGLVSRDRSAPDDLRRDLVQSMADRAFKIDLENGEYQVILVIGDQSYMHDMIDVYAEGIQKVNDLTVARGSFTEVVFTITVSDGQLNLVFHDDGGTDGNWVINAIVVRPPPPPAGTHFDFGTGASPVESGYTAVSESTLYSAFVGYGWESTVGLGSRDRGAPDDLRRDLVQSVVDRAFKVDLPNGEYQVILVIGDQSYRHDMIDVYAEGILKVNDLTAARGSFAEVVFTVTVSDGQLNLVFHDDGGTDGNWVINAIVVRPPPPPASTQFDFGTVASPLESGYTAVSESTLYSAFVGYGWDSTVGLSSRDRGAPDDLRRDLVQSTGDHTFKVDLPNGEYYVNLTIGDQSYRHDMIDVYAEGILKVNDLTAARGSFAEVVFTVTVSDGQLNLVFHDDGGTDGNWVINAITIEPVP